MATKTKGEWEAETIAEWKGKESSVWRAQKSTSPDGKVFIGVRQYIKTAKYEGPGKGGITFILDGDAKDSLTHVMDLFKEAINSIGSKSKKTTPEKSVVKENQFFLKKNNGKYLTSVSPETGARISSDKEKAQLFSKARAESILESILSDSWDMYAYTE